MKGAISCGLVISIAYGFAGLNLGNFGAAIPAQPQVQPQVQNPQVVPQLPMQGVVPPAAPQPQMGAPAQPPMQPLIQPTVPAPIQQAPGQVMMPQGMTAPTAAPPTLPQQLSPTIPQQPIMMPTTPPTGPMQPTTGPTFGTAPMAPTPMTAERSAENPDCFTCCPKRGMQPRRSRFALDSDDDDDDDNQSTNTAGSTSFQRNQASFSQSGQVIRIRNIPRGI